MKLKRSALVFCVMLAMFKPVFAAEPMHAMHQAEDSLGLSEGVRELLKDEMQAVQTAMQALLPALAAGDWAQMASKARSIRDSYILQRSLSSEQREELGRVLPEGFKMLDAQFHHNAGMLAHAAEQHNGAVANFYYSRLSEGCIQCHSHYAQVRFPHFAGSAAARQEHAH